MATIDVKDAAGSTVALEKPLVPGRGAAAASRPVVLSTEDKTALDALATQTTAAAILAKLLTAPATEAKQDAVITQETAINTVLGVRADAKSTATDATAITAMSVWKQISASVQAIASAIAGTLGISNAKDFASAATVTSTNSSASSAQLLAANSDRKGLNLTNTDVNAALVKFGTTASASSYTVRIPCNGFYEMPYPIYTGRIDVIWEVDGAGAMLATEL